MDERVTGFIELQIERRRLEAELERVKSRIADLEPEVVTIFEAQGVQRITQNGTTLYIRREIWAGLEEGVDSKAGIRALKSAGLEEYAPERINYMSLSAFLRELDKEGEPLPEGIRGVIRPVEKFKIGVRKGD